MYLCEYCYDKTDTVKRHKGWFVCVPCFEVHATPYQQALEAMRVTADR